MNHTISQFLINELYESGVRQVFGVPGDFVLQFYKSLENSPIKIINTCDEQGAGFAADAYARLKGLGVVCVTYSVGGLKVLNTTAEAYSEKSPVVVISGAPGTDEIKHNPKLHHKVGDFDTQFRLFSNITVAAVQIRDPKTAMHDIQYAIHSAKAHNQPVYIELPRNIIHTPIHYGPTPTFATPHSDEATLNEAIEEILSRITAAKNPVILAGVEVQRNRCEDQLISLAKRIGCPVASTVLGKSVVSESLPFYMGVYQGGISNSDVQKHVENSDCLILLGALLTDMNLGIFTANLNPKRLIAVGNHRVQIGHHVYNDVTLRDVLDRLKQSSLPIKPQSHIPQKRHPVFKPQSNQKMTINRLMMCLDKHIGSEHMVVADIGDALFASLTLKIEQRSEFISPAYYTSIGFAVPAAIGASFACPNVRPVVLAGDGAFQMTGLEFSTIARFKLTPIIIVINNQGYGTERPMLDGVFNDLHNWHYSKIPEMMGYGIGLSGATEEDCAKHIGNAFKDTQHAYIIEVQIDKYDMSEPLKRLTHHMKHTVNRASDPKQD